MLKNVTDTVFYVGVDDKDIDLFENQYIVPNGLAYNSYVIMDEKIAIMDMVDAKCADQWVANVAEVLGDRQPDYLIISHLEPDHSVNLGDVLAKYIKDSYVFVILIIYISVKDITNEELSIHERNCILPVNKYVVVLKTLYIIYVIVFFELKNNHIFQKFARCTIDLQSLSAI